MPVRFFKSKWEAGHLSIEEFFERCARDKFQGVAMGLSAGDGSVEKVRRGCEAHGMQMAAHVATSGKTPAEHGESLMRQLALAQEAGAVMANCHLGSDFFTFEESADLFRQATEWSKASGIPVFQETHRGRPLYNLPDTVRYLEACPGLELTADISHFMCVHESDLADRREWLDRLVPHCGNIHARIGFAEGPQVAHPLAPEWAGLRRLYLDFWKRIVEARKGDIAILPEAGPPPYMPVIPFTGAPLADAWQVNVAVRDWLAGEMG